MVSSTCLVICPNKSTTKVRVVYDCSLKYREKSLNDFFHPGSKLQQDLINVPFRFRRYPNAVVCDIAEMYLRIIILPIDHQKKRVLWRFLKENPLKLTPNRFMHILWVQNMSKVKTRGATQCTRMIACSLKLSTLILSDYSAKL